MKMHPLILPLMGCALALGAAGCRNAPGKPKSGDEVPRPGQVMDVGTLYAENCAACHGKHGTNGAAIALANPAYLAAAGSANIQRITAAGVKGTMMPAFTKSAGGMLTDQQVAALADGIVAAWATPAALDGQTPPAYASTSPGDAASGQAAFKTFCARCHGADGTGDQSANLSTGSLVDPSYLSLISDQGLRSFIIAGQPDQGMPDWRSNQSASGDHALTDREVTDIVAWIGTHRTATPGQVYRQHP